MSIRFNGIRSIRFNGIRSLCYDRRVGLSVHNENTNFDFDNGSNNGNVRFTDDYVELIWGGNSRAFNCRRINFSDCDLRIMTADCQLADTANGKDGLIIRTYSMDTGAETDHDMRMDVVDRRNMDKDLRGRDPLLSLVNGAGETVAYTNDDIEDRKLLAFVGIRLKDDGFNE